MTLGSSAASWATASSTASRRPASGETSASRLSSPCSDCASRSRATSSGSAPSVATTTSSLGPASPSMPTTPATWRLASVTYAFPGPTITSTRGTVSVPYASAAIAWAPPIL